MSRHIWTIGVLIKDTTPPIDVTEWSAEDLAKAVKSDLAKIDHLIEYEAID